MPKTQQRNQHKKQQRALQKRSQRKKKLARRANQETSPEKSSLVIQHAREFALLGSWVQQDWQQHGIVSLTVARIQPDQSIVFGRFLVDTFCLGLKDTFFGENIEPTQFHNDILPRLYQGLPPVNISNVLAHEIIYGSIEFSEMLGFRPHRLFNRTKHLLESSDTYKPFRVMKFGYQGVPTYIANPDDNELSILRTLRDNVGDGNFNYVPSNAPPSGHEEYLQPNSEAPPAVSSVWAPGKEVTGDRTNYDSGLWVPNQKARPANDNPNREQPDHSPLWVPES